MPSILLFISGLKINVFRVSDPKQIKIFEGKKSHKWLVKHRPLEREINWKKAQALFLSERVWSALADERNGCYGKRAWDFILGNSDTKMMQVFDNRKC